MNFKERYILMNKDNPVAGLNVDLDTATIATVYNIVPSHIGNFNNWVQSRTSIFGRENLLKMAKLAGISNELEYLTISKALSINDTFWVNDTENPTTWNKINPYTNRLSRIMAEIAINGIQHYKNQHIGSPSPQYNIDGNTDKCVKRVNGELYIYKTDGEQWSDLAGCRPYSEYFASILANKLKLSNFVKYNIKINKTQRGYYKPYVFSKLFTSEKYGLIQMYNSRLYGLSFNELDEVWKEKGDTRSRLLFREMLLLDSITLNFDRHLGNWGLLVDNDTYEEIGLAPIYDNDCGLGALTSIQYKTADEAYNENLHKYSKLDFGDYDKMAYEALKIPIIRQHFMELGKTINLGNKPLGLSDNRFKFIQYIINKRIYEINKLL